MSLLVIVIVIFDFSDFLPVLRSAYELISLKSNTSPVVVRDTIEEDS